MILHRHHSCLAVVPAASWYFLLDHPLTLRLVHNMPSINPEVSLSNCLCSRFGVICHLDGYGKSCLSLSWQEAIWCGMRTAFGIYNLHFSGGCHLIAGTKLVRICVQDQLLFCNLMLWRLLLIAMKTFDVNFIVLPNSSKAWRRFLNQQVSLCFALQSLHLGKAFHYFYKYFGCFDYPCSHLPPGRSWAWPLLL